MHERPFCLFDFQDLYILFRMILPCTRPATVESHFEKIANDSKTACQIARPPSDEQGVFKCSL